MSNQPSKTWSSRLNLAFQNRRRSLHVASRRGATAVEFAMVLPVFLLTIAVSVECARVSLIRSVVQHAAYEGSRIAMMEGTSEVIGEAAAQEIVSRGGVFGATIDVVGRSNTGAVVTDLDDAQEVTCTVSVPLNQNTILLPVGNITINSDSSMRTDRYNGFFDASTIDEE